MAPLHIATPAGAPTTITAHRLTREAFAPFGEVIQNPRPDVHPSRFAAEADAGPPPPFDAVSANQGSAIKYQHVTRMVDRYDRAPSGAPARAVMNMFVCAARQLPRRRPGSESTTTTTSSFFEVNILERHPYTTQTFTPLSTTTSSAAASPTGVQHGYYLVIVAPNDAVAGSSSSPASPGVSPPDLAALRAFVATTDQAVTYGAGTWHAPMVALGPAGSTVDFVVTQFANGVGAEDCQEVVFGTPGGGDVCVEVPEAAAAAAVSTPPPTARL